MEQRYFEPRAGHSFLHVIAVGESFLIVKLRYSVKDNLTPRSGDDKNWICPMSPTISSFKNFRVELDGIEVTQLSNVSEYANRPAHHESNGKQQW